MLRKLYGAHKMESTTGSDEAFGVGLNMVEPSFWGCKGIRSLSLQMNLLHKPANLCGISLGAPRLIYSKTYSVQYQTDQCNDTIHLSTRIRVTRRNVL